MTQPGKWKVIAITWRIPTLLTFAGLTAFTMGIGMVLDPACRSINLHDSSIDYPYDERELFPTYSLFFIVALPVVLVYLPVIYLISSTTRPAHREFLTWALTQAIAWILQEMMVDTSKLYAARFRPDYIGRLRIQNLVVGNNPPQWINGTAIDLCEHQYINNVMLREGRLSWPSGHSSATWASMVTLCLFLVSKLRPWYHQSLFKLVICLLPLTLAFVVAASRTLDYRHNFSDVLTGGILGAATSFISVFFNMDYISPHGVFVPKRPTHPHDKLNLVCDSEYTNMAEKGLLHTQSASVSQQRLTERLEVITNESQVPVYPGLLYRK